MTTNLDSLYFMQRLADISAEELARSFTADLQSSSAAATIDAMLAHKKAAPDNQRYFSYSDTDDQLFITAGEYRSRLLTDSNRVRQVMQAADQLLDLHFSLRQPHIQF